MPVSIFNDVTTPTTRTLVELLQEFTLAATPNGTNTDAPSSEY